MFTFGKKTLLAAALAFGLTLGVSANEPSREIVVIGDNLSAARDENSWLNKLAKTGGDVVNALRPQWRSAETWYVREVLSEHPAADAYVLMISANDLAALKRFDAEELHRIAARAGYMIDLIRGKNSRANIVLIAPPAAGSDLVAMSAEILAISLEKIAKSRDVKFLSFLDTVTPVKGNVYPHDKVAQEKIAGLIRDELGAPKISERAPLAAELGIVAPPSAGYAVASQKDSAEFAHAVAADFSAFKPTRTVHAQPDNERLVAEGKVRDYISERDLATVLSEEGIMLASGIAGAINEMVNTEWQARQAAQMEKLFTQNGAETFAQLDFQPPFATGEISAIVPPAGEARFLDEAVNQVKIASTPPLAAAEFADTIAVPGTVEFDREPRLATATVIRPTLAEIPAQDFANAPWNRPRDTSAETPLVIKAAPRDLDYPLPEVEFADAGISASTPKVEQIYQGEALASGINPSEELPLAKLKDPTLRAFNTATESAVELASAVSRRRAVNDEKFLAPQYEPLFATPGYAVYIHTSFE